MGMPLITQENVHIFIPFKVAKSVSITSEELNVSWKDILLKFYNSDIYEKLELEETKMWHESVVYILQEFKDKMEKL
jgi:hypothetical protein